LLLPLLLVVVGVVLGVLPASGARLLQMRRARACAAALRCTAAGLYTLLHCCSRAQENPCL